MRQIISYKHPEVQGGGLSLEEHSCFCSLYLPYCLFYSHFFPLKPHSLRYPKCNASVCSGSWPCRVPSTATEVQLQPEAGVAHPTPRTLQAPSSPGWLLVIHQIAAWRKRPLEQLLHSVLSVGSSSLQGGGHLCFGEGPEHSHAGFTSQL